MTVKLLTEHHLECLSLKWDCKTLFSLHLSKCHIVGKYMSRRNYVNSEDQYKTPQNVFIKIGIKHGEHTAQLPLKAYISVHERSLAD